MARLISDRFREWEEECEKRWNRLKEAEEELNRIFIDEYGISDELDPYVADKDVTVRKADLSRDIKSLLSYAVGCIFGRYSLDCDGLCFAGGEWDSSKYRTVIPAADNIVPIGRQYKNDLTSRIADFVEKVYGSETLAENLQFIAFALGGDGEPLDVIEKYLLKEFFPDHCRVYKKRPIYWMFDSGKKCHLKAVTYMHRWSGEVPQILRERYVLPYMAQLREMSAAIESELKTAPSADKPRLKRRYAKYGLQYEELRVFAEKLNAHTENIDLDDGVKVNYGKFEDVLEKIK